MAYVPIASLIIRVVLVAFSIVVMSLIMTGPGVCPSFSALSMQSCLKTSVKITIWNKMKKKGIWGQLAVILLSPVMSLAALTICILTLLKDRLKISVDVASYQVSVLSTFAFFSLILAVAEFYFAAFFLTDIQISGFLPSRLVFIRVYGWIAAACFELLSVILYVADALLIRRHNYQLAADQRNKPQISINLQNQPQIYAPNQFPAQQFAPNPYQGQQNTAMQCPNQYPQEGQYTSGQHPQSSHYSQAYPSAPFPPPQVAPTNEA
ncbi:hypothetical protein L596_028832 [Steinernema carpocapsae]|uniref:MARVEL domain-containing protein n=1 Tax=Steinernema carpocapsae TaxID=34508 RepID=A0A4V6XVN8_STECR|nr:hypothetical protein L596_028832 [Steinernema carpocapsae]